MPQTNEDWVFTGYVVFTGGMSVPSNSVTDASIVGNAGIDQAKLAVRTSQRVPILPDQWLVWDAASMQLPSDGTTEAAVETASFFYEPTVLDSCFFVAVRAYRVVGITGCVEVAGTGGACTAVIRKAPSGTDIASGTALHTGSYNLVGTVDTNQSLALSATSSDLDIAAGTRIGFDLTGTPTSARGAITVLLTPAPSADDLRVTTGTFGSAPTYISSGDLKNAGSTTRYARTFLRLPADYVAGQALTLRAVAGMVTTIASVAATVDFEVWRVDLDGTLGAADLCATNALSINNLTAANKDFTITPTTLGPGDLLDVRMAVTVNDSGTGTAVIGAVWGVELQAVLR